MAARLGIAVLMVLSATCSPGCTATPAPAPRSHVELEKLYLSAKQLEAIVSVDRDHAEPFRLAAQEFMRHYLIANDWAAEENVRAVVKAYGEAIPFVKSASVNLANKETWARLADAEAREEVALKLSRTENQYADLATKAIDGAVEAFGRAHALYVQLSAKASP